MRYGYLTGLGQLIQPPELSQIGLSFNDNTNFALLGRRRHIIDFCLTYRTIPVELHPATTLWRIPPDEDRITIEVRPVRSCKTIEGAGGSVLEAMLSRTPFGPVMVVIRPFDRRKDTLRHMGLSLHTGCRTLVIQNGTMLGDVGSALERALLLFPRGFRLWPARDRLGVRRYMSWSPGAPRDWTSSGDGSVPTSSIRSLSLQRYYTEPVLGNGGGILRERRMNFYGQSPVDTASVTSLPLYSGPMSSQGMARQGVADEVGDEHRLPPPYEEIALNG